MLTLQLAGEYGLRNKREIWRIQLTLSKVSHNPSPTHNQTYDVYCDTR